MAQSNQATVPTLPGGDHRGKLITDLSISDYEIGWWAKEAKQQHLRDACAAEVERRKRLPQEQRPAQQQAPQQQERQQEQRHDTPPQQQRQADPPQQSRALANTRSSEIVPSGAYRDAQRATEALNQAASMGHLVAPAPMCGTLLEGCELGLAAVKVDIEHETYEIPGGKNSRGLAKVALDKIAGAAGVSWDPNLSRRMDDGSDHRYVHYKAVGRVRDFDGTWRTIQGEKEVDMRDGSPQVEAIREREAKKKARAAEPGARYPYNGDGGDGQIREIRLHILGHAETKARLRAIRSLGVRTSYDARELEKPFVVAKLQFTGHSNDPEARRMFNERIADSFLGAGNALYGAAHAPELPPATPQGHTPPPVGSVPEDDSAITTEGEDAGGGDDPNYGPPRQGSPDQDRY